MTKENETEKIVCLQNAEEHITSVAIVGRRGSGKTALAYQVIESLREPGMQAHILRHPKPHLLPSGYCNLSNIGGLAKLHDCIVWVDEPQLCLPLNEQGNEEYVRHVLSIARHNDVTIVFSTSETRWYTMSVEAYIDVWLVKDIDYLLVKRGGMVQKVIQESVFGQLDPKGFSLPKNQVLCYGRTLGSAYGGVRVIECKLPWFWTDALSKAYKGL